MAKKIKHICKNCRLFDEGLGVCSVIILHEGEKVKIPVSPDDPCFFEEPYFDPITNEKSDFNEIKQIRMWVEDENGNKTDENGTVFIEY